MEESAAAQLIEVEIDHPEYAIILNDIREFDWKIINKLRKEDIARVARTGFTFKNKGLDNQKQELKTFLLEHPSTMSSDFEGIITKFNIFGRIIGEQRMKELNESVKKKQPKKRAIKYEPKVEEVEEEDEEFVPEEEEEEEEEETKRELTPEERKREKIRRWLRSDEQTVDLR